MMFCIEGPVNLATSANKEEKFSHSGVLPQGGASSFPFLFTGGKIICTHYKHTQYYNTINFSGYMKPRAKTVLK